MGYYCPPLPIYGGMMTSSNFPRYWPFVRGIHRSPSDSPHKGQWRGAVMFSLVSAWTTAEQTRSRWFETPWRSLWCHCNGVSCIAIEVRTCIDCWSHRKLLIIFFSDFISLCIHYHGKIGLYKVLLGNNYWYHSHILALCHSFAFIWTYYLWWW